MKRLTFFRLFSLFSLLALILSGCSGKPYLSTLKPAGEVAQTQYDLMILSTLIMVLVIIVVTIIFIIVLVRFRRKPGDDQKIPKQIEGSHKLEMVWTIIPIILLLVLAVPTVKATFQLADVKEMDKKNEKGNREVLVINVRANLFWWEFEYPDLGIITSQDLIVPTDEKVYFSLKASDVKHSFWIPPVGGKVDANTDNINKFWLEFDSKKSKDANNLFQGKCAEFCGDSHALMDFKVKTISRKEFNQWVMDMKNADQPKPTTTLSQQGEELFNASCISCHSITPQDKRPEKARLAPNLANFGERSQIAGILPHTKEELKNWIKDPEEIKPGNRMSNTYPKFNEQQLEALAEYLMDLKVQQ